MNLSEKIIETTVGLAAAGELWRRSKAFQSLKQKKSERSVKKQKERKEQRDEAVMMQKIFATRENPALARKRLGETFDYLTHSEIPDEKLSDAFTELLDRMWWVTVSEGNPFKDGSYHIPGTPTEVEGEIYEADCLALKDGVVDLVLKRYNQAGILVMSSPLSHGPDDLRSLSAATEGFERSSSILLKTAQILQNFPPHTFTPFQML